MRLMIALIDGGSSELTPRSNTATLWHASGGAEGEAQGEESREERVGVCTAGSKEKKPLAMTAGGEGRKTTKYYA